MSGRSIVPLPLHDRAAAFQQVAACVDPLVRVADDMCETEFGDFALHARLAGLVAEAGAESMRCRAVTDPRHDPTDRIGSGFVPSGAKRGTSAGHRRGQARSLRGVRKRKEDRETLAPL